MLCVLKIKEKEMAQIPGVIKLTKEGLVDLLNGKSLEIDLRFLTKRVIIEAFPQAIEELAREKQEVVHSG